MIKALIIEDEARAAQMLEIMLGKTGFDIEVTGKCSDLPAGVRSIRKLKPDLVFLDIEMPGYSGLQLLEFFNPEEIDFSIIFTTAFNEYAIRAFEFSAIDYLLKPIQMDKLKAATERFLRLRQKDLSAAEQLSALKSNLGGSLRRLAVPLASGVEIVKLDEITYLQADGSYCKIFLENGNCLTISKNLKYFEDQLSGDQRLMRIHRSYIVNLNFIKKVLKTDGGSVTLENGTVLPITGEKIDELIETIAG